MKEVTFQNHRTKNYATITISSGELGEKGEEREKQLLRWTEIQLNKHGWYKTEL